MDVELYVYDLSGGIARQMSASLLGVQIDAVYHTSIVMEGVEYVYDSGIQTVQPGNTHLGQPLQILKMGKTELPLDVIMDYLESMKEIFTVQAYDLWTHNCNNFSNDFATFLVGKGIPSHIANLPATVLNSPFGRMMRPMIDDVVRNSRRAKEGGLVGVGDERKGPKKAAKSVPKTSQQKAEAVWNVCNVKELEDLLQSANSSCAIVFFTSKTCGPCRPLYSVFDELAEEAAYKAIFIKADIDTAPDISNKYLVRATPTFMTFLKGKMENQWVGADPAKLRGNVGLLLQMAWPPHRHESLKLRALRSATTKPILYSKVPPLDKLMAKIGEPAKEFSVEGVRHFIEDAAADGAAGVHLPDMKCFGEFLRKAVAHYPPETMFPIVDLVRVAMADPRFSGYFAADDKATIASIFIYVNNQKNCPYSLRLVALQTACNLFSSPLYPPYILSDQAFTPSLIELITTSLLDDTHHSVRVAAASLAFNIAAANSKRRIEENREDLLEGDQVELAASLLEAISVEEKSPEGLKGFLLALGYLVFCLPRGSELVDLLKAMDAQSMVLGKAKLFPKEPLIQEIGTELLGKGIS